MSAFRSTLLLFALSCVAFAQEPTDGSAGGGNDAGAAPAEDEWVLPAKEAKKFQKLLQTYLRPGKKTRPEILESFEKFVAKKIDGHSALEDVYAIADMAMKTRVFNPKTGRKGKVVTVDVRPDVHGFPGGIGTVKYSLYLPKNYDVRKALSPVLFCLPDNKKWPDGAKFITEIWTKRVAHVEDDWIVVVPHPQTKGEKWDRPKSLARAMIALRHVMGTFDADKKSGGPATDSSRIVLDGRDTASIVAARFPEIFQGVVLRNSDGKTSGTLDVRRVGGLSGLPAYSIFNPKRRVQRQFAEKLKARNPICMGEPALDDTYSGDPDALESWLKALPEREQPAELRYFVHEASFQRHHWINVLEFDGSVKPAPNFIASVDLKKNEVRIEVEGITRFELFLNDAIVDLGKEVTVIIEDTDQEMEFIKETPVRQLSIMLQELVASNAPWRVYPVRYTVDLPVLRARQAEKDAAEAAKNDANKKKQGAGAQGAPNKAAKK